MNGIIHTWLVVCWWNGETNSLWKDCWCCCSCGCSPRKRVEKRASTETTIKLTTNNKPNTFWNVLPAITYHKTWNYKGITALHSTRVFHPHHSHITNKQTWQIKRKNHHRRTMTALNNCIWNIVQNRDRGAPLILSASYIPPSQIRSSWCYIKRCA